MDMNPNCPICQKRDWKILGAKTYRRPDSNTDEYVRRRLEILFDDWMRGETETTLKYVGCRNCGFVTSDPRPTDVEITLKYHRLNTSTSPPPPKRSRQPFDLSKWRLNDERGIHEMRAKELFDRLRDHIKNGNEILDYGGGSGQLMLFFVKSGFKCDVVDYDRYSLPGLAHAGCTLDDLDTSARYDLIVCSHVFEHLAKPFQIASALIARLSDNGHLYVEVPCEIWRAAPRPSEPLTHINYFVAPSLISLITQAGGEIQWCGYSPFTTYSGNKALATKALVRRGSAKIEYHGLSHTEELIAGRLQPLLSYWL